MGMKVSLLKEAWIAAIDRRDAWKWRLHSSCDAGLIVAADFAREMLGRAEKDVKSAKARFDKATKGTEPVQA